jgi:hypothetical protein
MLGKAMVWFGVGGVQTGLMGGEACTGGVLGAGAAAGLGGAGCGVRMSGRAQPAARDKDMTRAIDTTNRTILILFIVTKF